MSKDKVALVIGVNHYRHLSRLYGCATDASAVADMLRRNGDASRTGNFYVDTLIAESEAGHISRKVLRQQIQALFTIRCQIALLYFAGHGSNDHLGAHLMVTDSELESPGISLDEVVKLANKSPAQSRIIILDSCHSGAAGENSNRSDATEIINGVTILTACTKDQYSLEENGAGLFTSLFVNALRGAGANLVGEVTPASVYAHIDQSLPPGMQRPVFKTSVTEFVSLRHVEPAVSLDDLHRITEFFPSRPYIYKLDPAHEPERTGKEPPDFPKPDPDKMTRFAILQKFNRNGLVVPVDAPHMWHAAVGSNSCK